MTRLCEPPSCRPAAQPVTKLRRRVTVGVLANISQEGRRHHLTADQEGATDESPTSTRNGANLVGWARFKVSEGGNKAETRGRNHDVEGVALVNLSRPPPQPSFDFQPGFGENLHRNISRWHLHRQPTPFCKRFINELFAFHGKVDLDRRA